jgi:hypothetical protein
MTRDVSPPLRSRYPNSAVAGPDRDPLFPVISSEPCDDVARVLRNHEAPRQRLDPASNGRSQGPVRDPSLAPPLRCER